MTSGDIRRAFERVPAGWDFEREPCRVQIPAPRMALSYAPDREIPADLDVAVATFREERTETFRRILGEADGIKAVVVATRPL